MFPDNEQGGEGPLEAEVKWYNARKGFGFVLGPDGQDVFFHASALTEAGIEPPETGDKFMCEIGSDRQGRRLVTRIHEPTEGRILFDGVDITHADAAAIRPLRRRLQMVFQDPYASLNPRMTVGDMLAEPMLFHGIVPDRAAARGRVVELLDLVGLPARAAERYPHEFSGGQRQRIGTARALAVDPALVVADEPISSLDVNIQAQVINLLVDLQERLGLTYLFIAHDLAVVRHVSDRIVVLYLGKVMEVATAADLFERPLHPYSVALLSAVPIPDVAAERARRRMILGGEPPSAIDPPSGCRFRTRCPLAKPVCAEQPPPLVEHRPGQFAACHFAGELA